MDLRRICIVSGAFGVGKSEIAMNLSLLQARAEGAACLVDLDVVNPYFRSRESRRLLRELSVEVISSAEGLEMADLPALSPAIAGAIEGATSVVIDVGGDRAGATALGRFESLLRERPYDFLLVTNFNRPFCTSAAATAQLAREIEAVARLKLTGIVSNTHMMSATGSEDIERGIELSLETGRLMGVPVATVAVSEDSYRRGVRTPAEWQRRMLLLKRFNGPDSVFS